MKTQKKDFVELKFTGYANGEVFDSNIEEDLKKIYPDAKPKKTTVVIGENLVVQGFDKALEDKDIGKEYSVELDQKESFGDRKRDLIRTLPLASFTGQKIYPQPGMIFTLDNYLVKIVAVSGARVTADFNNPLAGKKISYKFTITRKVEDEKEKVEVLLQTFFHNVPEFELKESELIVKLPKKMKQFVEMYKEKFKEILGKDLKFEEKEETKKTKELAVEQ